MIDFESKRSKFKELINKIKMYNIDVFNNKIIIDNVRFGNYMSDILYIKNIVDKIEIVTVEYLPARLFDKLIDLSEQIEALFKKIMDYDTVQYITGIEDDYSNDFITIIEDIQHHIIPILSFNFILKKEYDQMLLDLKSLNNEFDNFIFKSNELLASQNSMFNNNFDNHTFELKKIVEKGEKEVTKIKKLLEAAKASISEKTIKDYQKIFDKEAEDHAKAAVSWIKRIYWLGGTFTVLLIAAIISVAFIELDQNQYIQLSISKIALFTFLIYLLTFSVKNYKSQMHNSILFKQKSNALATFEVFYDSSDEKIKNAVLILSSNAIFEKHNSAYSTMENEKEPVNSIIDIMKEILKK